MCAGIDHCSKKNCLEQERCLFPTQKVVKKIKINRCQIHKKFCSNERVCEILGQCVLDHPRVKTNKVFTRELKKASNIKTILRIFERHMSDKVKVKKKRK